MQLEVLMLEELEDGSAILEVEMDKEMKEFLIQEGLMGILMAEAEKVINEST